MLPVIIILSSQSGHFTVSDITSVTRASTP